MDHQNVTLSLPRHIVLKARHIAVERGTSLSKLLSAYLEEVVQREPEYERARRDALAMMCQGLPMGFDEPQSTREQLHER
jgi:hypothetical protein